MTGGSCGFPLRIRSVDRNRKVIILLNALETQGKIGHRQFPQKIGVEGPKDYGEPETKEVSP